MYLYVLLVNDTIEASDLLCLLGVGLLKLAQTLVYLAQNNIYISTVVCHCFWCKDKRVSPHGKITVYIP